MAKVVITTPVKSVSVNVVNENAVNALNVQETETKVELKGLVASPILSAYQSALNNGFVGSEEQWLESLRSTNIDFTLSYNIAKL